MFSPVADLTVITDLLTSHLRSAVEASPRYAMNPFPFEVSGLMPAVPRANGVNVMSFYLLHVARDPYWRNTPVQGQRALTSGSQPLALNLSYLLTSYAEKDWFMEQYLMSVALQYFHANPVCKTQTAEFTVTVEADTIDEMSRLWQAITVPIRLSALFRVAVVFLDPEDTPLPQVRPPVLTSLSVAADLNAPEPGFEAEPQLFDVALQVEYQVPPAALMEAQTTNVTQDAVLEQTSALPGPSVTVAVAGGKIRVHGSGLDEADASGVFLSAGGSEWPVTGWRKQGLSASGSADEADELVIELPPAYGATPAADTPLAATPFPGQYQLCVGNAGSAFRSNKVPIAIAPVMTGIYSDNTLLAPSGEVYTMDVVGLVDGATQVWLDETKLAIGAVTAAGVAAINMAAGAVAWILPGGLVSGSFMRVRVIVNSVEAPPGWWVKVP